MSPHLQLAAMADLIHYAEKGCNLKLLTSNLQIPTDTTAVREDTYDRASGSHQPEDFDSLKEFQHLYLQGSTVSFD